MTKCKAGCGSAANYGRAGTRQALYCLEHKDVLHVNVTSKRCQHVGCDTLANYNLPGEKVGKFCRAHAKGMINVNKRVCRAKGCNTTPAFDWPGRPASGKYCSVHKQKGMVNVKMKTCNYSDCVALATHGDAASRLRSRCKEHSDDGMEYVRSKRCTDCGKHPSYGYAGQLPIVCVDHKQPNMVAVKKRLKCEECSAVPAYNYPGETTRRFCGKHKRHGMENMNMRRCKVCRIQATHALPGSKATHCHRHAEEGMIRRPNGKCMKCTADAVFGNTKQGPLNCEKHKSDDDTNLVEHKCGGCGLLFPLNAAGRCSYCALADRPKRVAEKEVAQWLIEENLEFEHDKRLEGGACINLRPDFIFDAGTHFVILEVDENGHANRPRECEEVRMINIANALLFPTLFLRYNPDEFRDKNGRKQAQVPKRRRRKVLLQRLRAALTTPPSQACRAEYLYFDGYDPCKPDIKDIILNHVEMKDEPTVALPLSL